MVTRLGDIFVITLTLVTNLFFVGRPTAPSPSGQRAPRSSPMRKLGHWDFEGLTRCPFCGCG